MSNIFLACDGKYYHRWAINCIETIQLICPWIKITVLIVNPYDVVEIKDVRYFYEVKTFTSYESEIAYYQAVRFLKVSEIFVDETDVMIIDCDTILVNSFSEKEFLRLTRDAAVLRRPGSDKLLAGLITLGHKQRFRKDLKSYLEKKPIEKWQPGWDQNVLFQLTEKYQFKIVPERWMHLGKHREETLFLTLKGDKKEESRFFDIYTNSLAQIKEKYGIS